MQYLTLLPLLAAMTSHPATAAPSRLTARQEDWNGEQTGGIFCESRLQPNWGDCSTIMDGNSYFGEVDPNRSVCLNPRACRVWTEGNCRISFCNNENFEICNPASTWGGRARNIESECKSSNTGGYQSTPPPEPWSEVAIRLNTDWRRLPASLVYEEMSTEENKVQMQTLDVEANGLETRQADRFSDVVTRINVYKPGSAVFVAQVPNAGAYEVTTSKSETFSITASLSLGASAWDAISAEIGVSASFETTMTNTVAVTINIDCEGGTGQVYWRPFFDEYEGTLESSGQKVTIWVPKDTEASRMNYDYQCTG